MVAQEAAGRGATVGRLLACARHDPPTTPPPTPPQLPPPPPRAHTPRLHAPEALRTIREGEGVGNDRTHPEAGIRIIARGTLRRAVEWASKPNSVPRRRRGGDHSSRPTVARRLEHPTRSLRLDEPKPATRWTGRPELLLGLAGGGVCPATAVASRAVRSYRTISPLPAEPKARRRRYLFCGTIPRLTPGWRYQPPYPAQFGLSSRAPWTRAITFAHSTASIIPAIAPHTRPPGPLSAPTRPSSSPRPPGAGMLPTEPRP